MKRPVHHWMALAALLALAACTSTYYRALEAVGIEKRELLVERVEKARDAQSTAKKQFVNALEQYRSVVEVDAGDLDSVYDRMSNTYSRSKARADEVADRIDAVSSVADDLFKEWRRELDEYSDPELRSRSSRLLDDTRANYRRLLSAMREAQSSMEPALTLFNDQVLFLRHNLNARAIGSLRNDLNRIEEATAGVIREIERAIAEADRFITTIETT